MRPIFDAFASASLDDRSAEVRQAQAVLAQLASGQLPPTRIASLISRSCQTAWRLGSRRTRPRLLHALGLQFGLRAWLREVHPELMGGGPLLGSDAPEW